LQMIKAGGSTSGIYGGDLEMGAVPGGQGA
jgi:hypothetical protein